MICFIIVIIVAIVTTVISNDYNNKKLKTSNDSHLEKTSYVLKCEHIEHTGIYADVCTEYRLYSE